MLSLFRKAPRPNIVFVTIDQLRLDCLPAVPVFGELERRGVYFDQVVTYAPYTLASMHATFTGMYGYRNGVDAYHGSERFDDAHCRTLTSYLRAAGYRTRGDFLSKIIVPFQGFDEPSVHDEFTDDLTARHTAMLAEAAKGPRPFFQYLHYSNIHTDMVQRVIRPYDDFSAEYFADPARNRTHYVESARRAGLYLERLFAAADDLGLRDSTLFVVITDHGCSVGERTGERCYGVFTYEYTVRCFCFLLWQGTLPAGQRVGTAVRTIDIMPTLLDLLKIAPARGVKAMQGESLMPLVRAGGGPDREAFVETSPLGGPHPSPGTPNVKCFRTSEWKLIYNTTTNERELYHLASDPAERTNLWGRHPDVQAALWRKLQQHIERT